MNAKLLKKILAKHIQPHIRMFIYYNQVGFIPSSQGWFNISKSVNVIHHSNKRKDENSIIISMGVEKPFGKIQHPFTIKTPTKMSVEGTK